MSDQQLIGLLEKYLQGKGTEEERNALEARYETYRSAKSPRQAIRSRICCRCTTTLPAG